LHPAALEVTSAASAMLRKYFFTVSISGVSG